MKKSTILLILIIVLGTLLRIIAVDKYPAGLNADEAAIGYNAWSIILTGQDEHKATWPIVFRSFDDYKLPVYFYLVLPFVKVLGLNIWAVRLPCAILGSLSIWLLYLLVKELFREKENDRLALLAAFLLAISPWHLQFSRGGWEVNVSTFFFLLSSLAFIRSFKNVNYLFLFAISTVLALYTYPSARVVLPLLMIGTAIIFWSDFIKLFNKQNLKTTLIALFLAIVLIIPVATQLLSKSGQARFSGVSVFSDSGPYWRALALRNEQPKVNLYVKLINNQYLSYGLQIVQNYLSHYSLRFLFIVGDEIARSKVPGMGQSLISLLPFYFLGILVLLKLEGKGKRFVLAWFLLAPLAAAITFQSPHALRAENMVIPLIIIIAFGVDMAYEFIKKINFIPLIYSAVIIFFAVISFDFSYYLHQYYVHYPKELPYAWQYGFDQIAAYTQANYDKYDHIVISDRYDQPYILIAFFTKYPPKTLQNEEVMTPRDKFGFSTVRNLGKYEFRTINWGEDKKLKNTLIISADEPVEDSYIIHTVLDPAGKVMYKFLDTNK